MSVVLSVICKEKSVTLTLPLDFRFEKERYSASTQLQGKWVCNEELKDIVSLAFSIDGNLLHFGYPSSGTRYFKEGGRGFLKVNSFGYTKLLEENRPASGMLSNVDLSSLLSSGTPLPNVSCQQNTPTVNYVNYYDGTSKWKAITCYGIRAYAMPPYIRNANTVYCSLPELPKTITLDGYKILSSGSGSDISKVISSISEADVDGTPNAFYAESPLAISLSAIRHVDIPFDYEWVMDPNVGLNYRLNSSANGMNYDFFKVKGYLGGDIFDYISFANSDGTAYLRPITKITAVGNSDGFTTTYYCYHDLYH